MKFSFQSVFSEGLVPRERWRRGALSFAAAAFFTFLVNLSFTIWATTRVSNEEPDDIDIIWEGSNNTVKIWNTTLHVVINIISTVLLAGSNYCMQCLMAPTRQDLDKAHSEQRWLDIGIPTIRNFWHITLRRKLLWILLSISSFPIHLLFNSIIFASISTNEYYVYTTDAQSVLMGNTTSLPETLDTHRLTNMTSHLPNTTLNFIDASTCLNDYGTAYQSKRGSLLLIYNITGGDEKDTQYFLQKYGGPYGGASGSFDWVCHHGSDMSGDTPCDEEVADIKKNPDTWNLEVQSCYSNETQEHSKLFFSRTICWVVTCLNLLKGVIMLLVAYEGIDTDQTPILTIGDAVASYLRLPDEHTKSMCLKAKRNFVRKHLDISQQQFDPTRDAKFSAGSVTQWAVCFSLCMLPLFTCGLLLLHGFSTIGPSPGKYGPGVVHSDTIMDIFSSEANTLLLVVVLVNTPQVVMSLIYFNYNALFTCISLATEWDRFYSKNRKGLRVSTKPEGNQRHTYFLQLPYRYSLPLAIFSGALHWLISQSIFLVRIEVYGDDGKRQEQTTSCGWSPIAALLVMASGAALGVMLFALGLRRLRFGGIPVAGSCSAAIAAACHPDPSERGSLATLPLNWAVVSGTDVTPGHCSFTSKSTEKPIKGYSYE